MLTYLTHQQNQVHILHITSFLTEYGFSTLYYYTQALIYLCTERSGTGSYLSAGKPEVCDQLQKVCPNPNEAGRIPCFSAEFRFRDPKTTPGEDKGYSTGCTNPVEAWPLDGQRTLAAAREVKRSHTGNSPGTAVLQKSSTRPSPSAMQWPSGV